MISTRVITSSVKDVPETWIFEHYLALPDQLSGQEVRIKSVFKQEKTPSMYIGIPRNGSTYKFNDFSSGIKGNGFELVKQMFSLSVAETAAKIVKDYNEHVNKTGYSIAEFKKHNKYQIVDYEGRKWTELDAKYWMQFKIGSKTLEKYNVMPLRSYKMSNGENELVVTGNNIYGYFRDDGLIYKVYQPKNGSRKFLKVRNYLQGFEQLTYEKPNLVIHSSLKDMMAFEQFNFQTIECIAPDSENTLIPEKTMWELIGKYKTVTTIFDNDESGIKAVEKYREKYGVNGFTLGMEKDISDSIARNGVEPVKNAIIPLLIENIYTCKRCPEISTLA